MPVPATSLAMQAVLRLFQEELSLPAAELPIMTRDIWPEFALALLTDPTLGPGPQTDPAYNKVVDLYRQWVQGTKPPERRWKTAINFTPHSALASNAAGTALSAAYATTTIILAANEAGVQRNEDHLVVIGRQYQTFCALSQPLKPSMEIDL